MRHVPLVVLASAGNIRHVPSALYWYSCRPVVHFPTISCRSSASESDVALLVVFNCCRRCNSASDAPSGSFFWPAALSVRNEQNRKMKTLSFVFIGLGILVWFFL